MRCGLFILIIVLLNFSVAAENFYDNLSAINRIQLVQSYRAVGERFIELGQNERALYYLALADEIEATITNLKNQPPKKSTKNVIGANTKNSLALTMNLMDEETLKTLPNEEQVKQVFINYMISFTRQNSVKLLDNTANVFILPKYNEALTKKEQQQFFNEFFQVYPTSNLNFESFYQMDSLAVTLFSADKGLITLQAKPIAPAGLADWNYWGQFWATTHYYFFEKIAGRWLIIALDFEGDSLLQSTTPVGSPE
jgi:hypothetical protein